MDSPAASASALRGGNSWCTFEDRERVRPWEAARREHDTSVRPTTGLPSATHDAIAAADWAAPTISSLLQSDLFVSEGAPRRARVEVLPEPVEEPAHLAVIRSYRARLKGDHGSPA